MKHILLTILLCISLYANADSVNSSCLIGNSDYVEADFFYQMNNYNRNISDGIITIANSSEIPLVSLDIKITAEADGKEVTIYHEYKKFSPSIAGYMTFKIDGINYLSSYALSNIKISISNPRCKSN